MFSAKAVGVFLAVFTCTVAEPVFTARSTATDSPGQCSNTHLPTEATYRQGLAQYCNHIEDGITLHDKEEFVYTMELRDKHGYPIQWIYKMRYEDHSDTGEGPIGINRDTCIEKFKVWAEGKAQGGLGTAYCMDGDTKLIIGGKYIGGGSSTIPDLGRPGSDLWIETRQKSSDTWVPQPLP